MVAPPLNEMRRFLEVPLRRKFKAFVGRTWRKLIGSQIKSYHQFCVGDKVQVGDQVHTVIGVDGNLICLNGGVAITMK